MERQKLINMAKTLGWGVKDLNDNPEGIYVKGAHMQVFNLFSKGPNFWDDDGAWDYIIGRIRGGVGLESDDTNVITGERGKMLTEMMAYEHPSVKSFPSFHQMGNVYTINERKQGMSPIVYTMTVGIEIAGMTYAGMPKGEWKPFVVAMQDKNAIAQEKAMKEIYTAFEEWVAGQD